jgi:predicted ArsR family transcriptional regulator
MQATRRRILNLLLSDTPLSIDELARSLKMTKPNVRHHIKILEAEGFLIPIGQKETQGRGRPAALYAPTLAARQGDLELLVLALWREYFGEHPSKQRTNRQRRLARRLIGRYLPLPLDTPLPQRLYETVRIMNSIGYDAHWEAHADSPHLILAHCPFNAIYAEQADLCGLDACVMEILLGSKVEQISCRKQHAGTGSSCQFKIY